MSAKPTSKAAGTKAAPGKNGRIAVTDAELRLQNLLRASPMGIHFFRQNKGGTLIFSAANPAADKLLHLNHDRLVGLPLAKAFPGFKGTEVPNQLRKVCAEGEPWHTRQLDYRDAHFSGAFEMHCFQLEPGHVACMFLDRTENKLMETRLRHLTHQDPLTGIANRAMCLERIETALQRAKRRPDYRYAIIYIDLDRFKNINDTISHTAGDAVLVDTARRLRASVRELDTVARIGSDEFVVLMEEFDSYKRPIQAIKRIRNDLGKPFLVEGKELVITTSIGLVLGETPASSAEETLRNANLAMERAKAQGRNMIKSFTPSMLRQTLNVGRLESDMDEALARGDFFLAFQPIIHMGEHRQLFGFEALARWQHPERGLIMPSEFIPVAEDSGKVVELGYWALREGCRTLSKWRQRYPHMEDSIISVNLSPQQVPKLDFMPRIREILQETGLPARNLKLEVTETALMQSGTTVLAKFQELREMGVSFSVDDFGTGYSSLAYLTRLPLDHLKIDLSFVRMLEEGKDNLEIVRTIIQLAKSLRMDVVAEGVETESQQAILTELGCEYFQGFLFSRPLTEEPAEAFLKTFLPGGLSGS